MGMEIEADTGVGMGGAVGVTLLMRLRLSRRLRRPWRAGLGFPLPSSRAGRPLLVVVAVVVVVIVVVAVVVVAVVAVAVGVVAAAAEEEVVVVVVAVVVVVVVVVVVCSTVREAPPPPLRERGGEGWRARTRLASRRRTARRAQPGHRLRTRAWRRRPMVATAGITCTV